MFKPMKARHIFLAILLSLTMLLTGAPVNISTNTTALLGASVTKEYDPEAARMIVEVVNGTDLTELAAQSGSKLVRTGPLNYCTLEFKELGSDEMTALLQEVLELPGVLSAEWSRKFTIDTSITGSVMQINDPQYDLQWALKRIRADQVWTEGATGKGVIVAVIDTGADLDHPDLVDEVRNVRNLIQGYNAFTRSSLPGSDQDDNGHGTSVAGAIAALNNNIGIVGVAYNAMIMPIKAMDKHGEGEDDIIADGIIWAADHGARIINMSIGAESQTKILDDALAYAAAKGCLLIAASGNVEGYTTMPKAIMPKARTGRASSDSVAYPGAHPDVMAVSAVDMNDVIADFALTGSEILLSAPGEKVLTDYWSEKETGISYSTGTSIAAPLVSGAAALIWSKYPQLTAAEIRQALIKSAYDLGDKGIDDDYGYGRLDIYRAIKTLAKPTAVPSPAALGWEGGILQVTDESGEPEAALSIPAGAFPIKVDSKGAESKLTFLLNKATEPQDFPAGIEPAGDSWEISWGEAVPLKALSLELTGLNGGQDGNKVAFLYKWSNYRWIRVGGGVSSSAAKMQVTIYEPGIYRAGWSLEPDYERIFGEGRIQTAVEIARESFPTGADTVIVTRADSFPDALAGAPLAYKLHAPILLTHSDQLPSQVSQAITELSPQNILILGGTGAVSGKVEEELAGIAWVRRVAGEDRYDTASAIAGMLGLTGQAVVVNGADFPDAIASASHASLQGMPILLTAAGMLAESTEEALKRHSVSDTQVIGGIGVVTKEVVNQLPNPLRISGKDRFATSAEVLRKNSPGGKMLFVATGLNFPDALTGGILAALNSSNILLIPKNGPTPEQISVLEPLQGMKPLAFGGDNVVTAEAVRKVSLLIQ